MSKIKLLKLPKAPKLPKKPKENASLTAKQNYIKRVDETKAKYAAKVKAIEKENAQRIKINEQSKKLSKVIAGIGAIQVRPSAFTAKSVRSKYK